jgi:pantoate--beta-alanine ligase
MLTVIYTTRELQERRQKEKQEVGFVPTMGNLHAGHLSLLESALKDFSTVYFSIFVNPKQFGPDEDFNRYPRTLKEDLNLIEESLSKFPNSHVIVYAPKETSEVFPEGKGHTVSVLGLTEILEGEIRPGHFEGVTTVVYRLLELVKPRKVYLGLKDYQQWVVIKTMVKDLALPIDIIGMPIIREEEGLALSSRNQYLSDDQKKASLILSQSLRCLADILAHNRENLPKVMRQITEYKEDPQWNYLEIRDAETLSSQIENSKRVTILGVYQLGSTRLLDNLQMELK